MSRNLPHTPNNPTRRNSQRAVQDTPRENTQWNRDLSQDDLLRLADKAGNKAGVCMISLDAEIQTVVVAHIISREKRREEFEVSSSSVLEFLELMRAHDRFNGSNMSVDLTLGNSVFIPRGTLYTVCACLPSFILVFF